jgi:hypothetical protein
VTGSSSLALNGKGLEVGLRIARVRSAVTLSFCSSPAGWIVVQHCAAFALSGLLVSAVPVVFWVEREPVVSSALDGLALQVSLAKVGFVVASGAGFELPRSGETNGQRENGNN